MEAGSSAGWQRQAGWPRRDEIQTRTKHDSAACILFRTSARKVVSPIEPHSDRTTSSIKYARHSAVARRDLWRVYGIVMLRCAARATAQGVQHARNASAITRLGTDDPRMSKIVIHNGVVFTSGQTAADAGDDVAAQTEECLAKVDALLAEAGTNKSRALQATIWLKDINADFKKMNAVWNAWVDPEHKPVRATVESAMARPAILVEIQVTAATNE